MPFKRTFFFMPLFALGTLFFASVCPALSATLSEHLPVLRQYIVEHNLEQQKKSIPEHTYRGEEGILRIGPEVGRLLNLNVYTDQGYLKAVELFHKAEGLMKKAVEALTFDGEKIHSEAHVKKIAELALQHNQTLSLAWELMMSYRAKLTREIDDRLNPDICSALLEKILQEELKKASYNLRNALGNFYNRCRNLNANAPLNLENIKFVNYVFHQFTHAVPNEDLKSYDLDRSDKKNAEGSKAVWKRALGKSSSRFVSELEAVFEKHQKNGYPVDRLLFLALIRQESNYNPRSVSYVGAAGLAQIMPATAKNLGMKDIYAPSYLKEAGAHMSRERRLKKKASDLLLRITEGNRFALAKEAGDLMQKSLVCKKKRKDLFSRYRRELLKAGTDDRLNPKKAIEYGLKYFSQMMKIQKDDISLALASYNAGPHRIRQYHGIPPFEETIVFRNKIIAYYRIYQSRVGETISKR